MVTLPNARHATFANSHQTLPKLTHQALHISYPTYSTTLPFKVLFAIFIFSSLRSSAFITADFLLTVLTGAGFTCTPGGTSLIKAPHSAHLFLPFATTVFATRYSG